MSLQASLRLNFVKNCRLPLKKIFATVIKIRIMVYYPSCIPTYMGRCLSSLMSQLVSPVCSPPADERKSTEQENLNETRCNASRYAPAVEPSLQLLTHLSCRFCRQCREGNVGSREGLRCQNETHSVTTSVDSNLTPSKSSALDVLKSNDDILSQYNQ